MVFDIALHILAIVSVLAIVGSHRTQRPIHRTLETLHAIGEALPDECFAVDTDSEFLTAEELLEEGCAVVVEAAEELPSLEELFTRADEILPSEPVGEEPVEDFSDLLAISAPAQGIDTRWLSEMTTHALRTLGSLEGITGARRWAKAQAIAHLTSHYALA